MGDDGRTRTLDSNSRQKKKKGRKRDKDTERKRQLKSSVKRYRQKAKRKKKRWSDDWMQDNNHRTAIEGEKEIEKEMEHPKKSKEAGRLEIQR